MIPIPIFPIVELHAASQFTLYTLARGLHQITKHDRLGECELVARQGEQFAWLNKHTSSLAFTTRLFG